METCLNSDIRSIQVIVITLIVKIGPRGIILGVFQIILITSPRKHSLWTQSYFRSSLLSTREWIQVKRSDRKWKYVCVRRLKETQVICKVIWGIPVVLVFSYNIIQICLPSNSTWGMIQKIIWNPSFTGLTVNVCVRYLTQNKVTDEQCNNLKQLTF